MATIVAVAQLIGAVALLAVAVALAVLALRIKRLADEASDTIKQRVNPLLEEGERLLGTANRSAGRLEQNLNIAGRLLERVEGTVNALEPTALKRSVLTPMLTTLVSWVAGAKKAASVLRQSSEKKGGL